MAALFMYLLSKIRRPRLVRFQHPFGIPFPPVWHVTLDEEYLNQFEEIFIIGDVHGCLDELEELLTKAKLYSADILKIFVGDLVNKGPKSQEVLELVRSLPSTYSVRGNHDEVVLRVHAASKDPSKVIIPKNLWIKDLTKDNIDYLGRLPYTIQMPSLNVIVVHAGLVPGIPLEEIRPVDLVNMRNLELKDYFWDGGTQATAGNKGFPWAELWPGPKHVYFGHDAKRLLQQHCFATGLDTGCVYGKYLTGVFIKGPRKGSFVKVKAKQVYEVPKG